MAAGDPRFPAASELYRRSSRHQRTIRRRWRAAAAALAVLAVVVGVALALNGGSPPGAAPGARASAGRTAGSSSASGKGPVMTPSTTEPTVPRPPYPVGVTSTVVDDGGRLLPTTVRYPATAAGTDGRPLLAAGPFPLIVFSQGYAIAAEDYAALLQRWAAAGFVVADPSYPYTTPGDSGGLERSDIVHHPADLQAVIAALLADGRRNGDLLDGAINSREVGVAGHSDGGDVSEAVAEGSCCRDPLVKAAVIMSGAELTWFGGTFGGAPGVPLLVSQGTADDINPPACSEQIYDAAPAPRYYLNLPAAGHHVAYIAGWTDGFSAAQAALYRHAFTEVSLLFWRAYLDGDRSAVAQLRSTSAIPGAATLTSGAAVAVDGYCPGAPAG